MAELDFFPYKIQLVQPISFNATAARVTFFNKILTQLKSNEIDLQKIWFTDEAHFHLEGYVNKQNMRYWSQENPHVSRKAASPGKSDSLGCYECRNGSEPIFHRYDSYR